MIPSTLVSVGLLPLPEASDGAADALVEPCTDPGGFTSGAKVTFFPVVSGTGESSTSMGVGAFLETNVGKGLGNWKK